MAFQKFGDAVKQDSAFELKEKDEKVKTSTSKDEEDKKKKEKG
jgi:hypothetical protein